MTVEEIEVTPEELDDDVDNVDALIHPVIWEFLEDDSLPLSYSDFKCDDEINLAFEKLEDEEMTSDEMIETLQQFCRLLNRQRMLYGLAIYVDQSGDRLTVANQVGFPIDKTSIKKLLAYLFNSNALNKFHSINYYQPDEMIDATLTRRNLPFELQEKAAAFIERCARATFHSIDLDE